MHQKKTSFLEFEWTGDRFYGQMLAKDFDTELQVLDVQSEVVDRIPVPRGRLVPVEVPLSPLADAESLRLLQIGIERCEGGEGLSDLQESLQFYHSDSAERRTCQNCQLMCAMIAEVPDFNERFLDGMTPEEMLIEARQAKGLMPAVLIQTFEDDDDVFDEEDDIHESDCPLPDESERLELLLQVERVVNMEPKFQTMLDVLRMFEDHPEDLQNTPFARIVYRIVKDGLPELESKLLAGENVDDMLSHFPDRE